MGIKDHLLLFWWCAVFYGRPTELAIRAALYLALQPPGKLSPVQQIAAGTGLPQPYLAKIMRRLIAARLVRAFRGPGGGLELSRAPATISLWCVVRAVEGPLQPERCALGVRPCSPKQPCPLHRRWQPLRQEVQRVLEDTNLAVLASDLRQASPARKPRTPSHGRPSRSSVPEGAHRRAV